MHKHLKRTPALPLTHQDWLAIRKQGIGGSDAAAIMGLSPWASPFSVWAEKTGKVPDKQETEAMRQGRDFEDYVARRFMEGTGKKVRRDNSIIQNPTYPFALANVDRFIVGENAGLECKTTSVLNLKKFKNGMFPDTYYAQCMHYMAVTGAARWYLAVLILNTGFELFEIERDEDEIAALMEQEAIFWRYVESDMPPPVDGHKATGDVLKSLFSDGDSVDQEAITLFGRDTLIADYLSKKQQEKDLASDIKRIQQVLMQDLGKHEVGISDRYKVTWKRQVRTSFDHKALADDMPELELDGYFKTIDVRPLLVKEL